MKRKEHRVIPLLLAIIAACVLILAGCLGAGSGLSIKDGTSELDGVTGKITRATSTVNERTGSTLFDVDVDFTNNSDIDVMQVQYRLICEDKQGNMLDDFTFTYNGQDKAMAPGESATDNKGYQKKLDGTAARMRLELVSITSAEEMPPVRLPQKGEYLYRFLMSRGAPDITVVQPTSIVVGIDQGGFLQEATFNTPETLPQAVDALAKVRIGDETGEFVTDNYNYILVEYGDQYYGASLNLYNLETSAYGNYHIYQLEDLGALLSMTTANLTPVSRYGGGS